MGSIGQDSIAMELFKPSMKGNAVSAVRMTPVLKIVLIAVCLGLTGTVLIWSMWFRSNARKTTPQARTEREATILLNRAENASEAGDLTTATRLFDEVLQLDPGNPKALLYSAGIRQQSGDLTGAKQFLSRVGDAPPNIGATARYLEGTIALAEHKSRLAESLLLKARSLNPMYQPPLRVLARHYALQLRGEELTEVLDQLASIRRLTIEESAMGLLAGRPFVEKTQALPLLKQMVVQDPDDVQSLLAEARYFLQEGDAASAESLLGSVPQSLKDDSSVLSMLALVWDLNGTGMAEENRVLNVSRDSTPEAWELASRRAASVNDWEAVAKIDTYRLSRNPFSPAVSHSLATAFDRLQQSPLAKDQHQQTQRLDQLELLAYRIVSPRAQVPDVAIPIICEIADLLKDAGYSHDATQWLMTAESLAPGRFEVRSRLQMLYDSGGNTARRQHVEAPGVPSISITSRDRPVSSGSNRVVEEWQFRDVASETGIHFTYCNGQSEYKRILETIGGGAAVLDIDGDEWPDLYFPQGKSSLTSSPSLNDGLFRNQRGLRYSECTATAGIRDYEHSLSATVADFDNDGFADVFVTNAGPCRLFHNNGDGTFLDETPSTVRRNSDCSSCACFVDLNQDSLLDLFVANYVVDWERRCVNSAGEFATCHPHELQQAQNRLYQNRGDGEFSDVTDSSGLLGVTGRALGVVTADLNDDGCADVFVANDGTPNMLFVSDHSLTTGSEGEESNVPGTIRECHASTDKPAAIRLRDIATQSGVAVPNNGRSHAGMGIALSDFDRNGFLDLFVTNFYREQNTLYSGIGNGFFIDKSHESGLGQPSLELLGFGTQAIDINSDGQDDLVVLNGDIDDYSATGRPWKMPISVFRNDGDGRFIDMTEHSGAEILLPQLGRGLTRVDFDGDQVCDLVAVRHDGPVRLLRNETQPADPRISVRLVSRRKCRDAIGLQVTLTGHEHRQVRVVNSGDGFSASNERRLSFSVPAESEYQIEVNTGNSGNQLRCDAVKTPAIALVFVVQEDGSVKSWKIPQ